jgi:hypothetical protein
MDDATPAAKTNAIMIKLPEGQVRFAERMGRKRWEHAKLALEAYVAGEKDRALESWKRELRRDPGICGLRDRGPPWVRQQ